MIIVLFCFFSLVLTSHSLSIPRQPDPTTTHVLTPSISPNYRADVIIKDAKPAQLDVHITSCSMRLDAPLLEPVTVSLYSENDDIAFPITKNITFEAGKQGLAPQIIYIFAKDIGETYIFVNRTNSLQRELNRDSYKVKVIVVHSLKMRQVNIVIGWIYFVVWSISFYPQVFENYMRKSVIGLNFDFLCYNITGFIVYSIYNAGLFWIQSLQDQYFEKFGGSVIPVQPNDVFFAIHAAILTVITILQCFVYERADQKVSLVAKILVAIMWLFAGGLLIPVAIAKLSWLEYITSFSYIKLAVTLIKYVPQAYMNYKRKSTDGWSIGFVHSDFIGGVLSILQVFFLAYNNNQWSAIFGNFTKFGLALVSIIFDVLFLCQHYVFYKDGKMKKSVTTDIITMHDHVAKVYEQEVKDDE